MNTVRLTLTSGLVAIGMTLSSPWTTTAEAQSLPEPAAVISLTNVEQTLKDVDYLVDASGFGQMKFMIQTQVNHFLKGIDQSRASGVLLYMDEGAEQPSALGFVPVEDIEDLLDTLSGFAEVDEGDDYTTIITDDGKEILIKQIGKHAYFTDKAEMFERAPVDPAVYLGDLPERFNVAARIFGQRIPQPLRDKASQTIRDAYKQQLEELDLPEAADTEKQKKFFENYMQQFESLIQETDQLAIGMVIDEVNHTISGELEITGLEGSEVADLGNANLDPKPSRFGGFMIPGKVFNNVGRMVLTPEAIERYALMSDSGEEAILDFLNEESDLTELQFDVVKTAVKDLLAATNETLADGVLDTGMVAELQKGNMNGAAGFLFSDPSKIETVFKNLTAEFEDELTKEGGTIQLNAYSHKDITFHKITFPTPADEEEMINAVGPQLQIVFGVGKDAGYIAVGSDPFTLLKQAIDGPATETEAPTSLGLYQFHLAPLLQFTAEMEPDQPFLKPFADKLAAGGKDRLQYELKAIKNGFNIRMDLQDGFMELIQVATEALGQLQNRNEF